MQNDSLWLEKVLRGNLAKSKFQILKWKIVNTYRDFFHWISLKIGKKLEHFVIKVHSKFMLHRDIILKIKETPEASIFSLNTPLKKTTCNL